MSKNALARWGFCFIMGIFASSIQADEPLRLVFLGDSLTYGYNLEPEKSYPGLIQQRIDDAGLPFKVENAGVNADTTADGLRRLDVLLLRKIDVLVVALGINDGFRGYDTATTEKNLAAIIVKTRGAYPDCVIMLAGMKLPLDIGGQVYGTSFESIYSTLARQFNVALMPFLLKNVAGVAKLNQRDGIHPTAEGQTIIAGYMWEFIEPTLRQAAATRMKQTP
jgi:acyl-CoA thioesterase I